jgi:subtilisin
MARVGKKACFVLLVMLAASPAASSATWTPRPSADANVIPGQYIVVYKGSAESVRAETNARERKLGFDSDLRYRHALKGFTGELTPGQVRALQHDPEVAYVTPDRVMRASSYVPAAAGEQVPIGVRRIRAGTSTTVEHASGIGVAVLDSGVDLTHPDLNVSHGINCVTPGAPADDDNGHGTHVAGTIAAKNNGAGVVGVSPGTKIWAVKVLDAAGDGSLASIICGLDWVTANKASKNIEVLNMSFSGLGDPVEPCATTTDPMHKALCRVTGAGVLSVVAAGNSGWDFDYPPEPELPAAYAEVLTVTAIADSDGKGGRAGAAPSCDPLEADDYPATFSNFALAYGSSSHTIAAPGVCVLSTWPTNLSASGYEVASGTSMAAPHVAGIAALCENHDGHSGYCAGRPIREVILELQRNGNLLTQMGGYGFELDPRHEALNQGYYFGYLTGILDSDPPETWISAGPSGATRSTDATFDFGSGTAASFECRLDGSAWTACAAHQEFSGLADALHALAVRAIDGSGYADPSPETRVWTVDTASPDTSIDSGPATQTSSRGATFTFTSSEAGSRLTCRLDKGDWRECASPRTVRRLSEGSHRLSVVAIDIAGNRDHSPAEYRWKVVPRVARIQSHLTASLDAVANRLRELGLAKLLKRRSFVAKGIEVLTPGRLGVALSGTPEGGAGVARKAVLAKGSRTVARAGSYALKLKPTRMGRRLLRRDLRAKGTLRLKFRDSLGRAATSSRSVALHR